MLDRMVERAHKRDVFSREDTPIEQRVVAAFLYHAELSHPKTEPFVDRSCEAIRMTSVLTGSCFFCQSYLLRVLDSFVSRVQRVSAEAPISPATATGATLDT